MQTETFLHVGVGGGFKEGVCLIIFIYHLWYMKNTTLYEIVGEEKTIFIYSFGLSSQGPTNKTFKRQINKSKRNKFFNICISVGMGTLEDVYFKEEVRTWT